MEAFGKLRRCIWIGSLDFGDLKSVRSEALSQTQRSYARGQKLVSEGKKNTRNGRKQVAKGEDQIRNGQLLIDEEAREFCDEFQHNDSACR